jgi:small subunit ribosomal protein S19
VKVREEMVGFNLGDFAPTTKFIRHGGKMQRELEKSRSSKDGREN